MSPRGWRARYGFALAYLCCFAITDLVYVLLTQSPRATLIASTHSRWSVAVDR